MRNKSWLLLAGLALLGVAHPAGRMLGQAVYGSIIGTVTDSSGAAVPNAKVTITNVDKGVSVTTASNESGNYEQQHRCLPQDGMLKTATVLTRPTPARRDAP